MKSKSWQEIENHYIDLNNKGWKHEKLLELVQYIQSSGLSKKLFATTSLDKLILSVSDQIDYKEDSLHLEFDRQAEKWVFNYFGGQSYNQKRPEFNRVYESDKGIEKLNNFIKLINW